MRICIILLLLNTACGNRPELHMSDLREFSGASNQITLLVDGLDERLSESTYKTPDHGSTLENRWLWRRGGDGCFQIDKNKICDDTDILETRLHIYVISDQNQVWQKPLGGSIYDVLYRFVGSPPAGITGVVQFEKSVIGIFHSYGFSFFYKGKICQSITLNHNDRIFFGLSSKGVPLINSVGTGVQTRIDVPVSGWREYDIEKYCLR